VRYQTVEATTERSLAAAAGTCKNDELAFFNG
jgi:hypothetical protein